MRRLAVLLLFFLSGCLPSNYLTRPWALPTATSGMTDEQVGSAMLSVYPACRPAGILMRGDVVVKSYVQDVLATDAKTYIHVREENGIVTDVIYETN